MDSDFNEVDTEDMDEGEYTDKSKGENTETVFEKRRKTYKNRVSGEKYTGYKRTPLNVITHDQNRDARAIKCRCPHNSLPKRKTKSSFMCAQIKDEDRKHIFDNFWKKLKTWPEKKAYVKGLVTSRDIRRRRKQVTGKRIKSEGHDLFLPTGTGDKVRVCRTFFLNTIDLGRDTFMRWVKRDTHTSSPTSSGNEDQETATTTVRDMHTVKIKLKK